MLEKVRIATRESLLAMWQANHVKEMLLQQYPALEVELVPMTTRGDEILDTPLSLIGGKGLFIKELEKALLEKRADIAVHSMKDVPMELPEAFVMGAVLERAEVRDALVSSRYPSLSELPEGAVVGSSSLRRQIQLNSIRPDVKFKDCRGNINTRLAKLDAGDYDAIILASCGLMRLSLEDRIAEKIDTDLCLPAAGQAAIGIECREDDIEVQGLLKTIEHDSTRILVECERAISARLGASCNLPIAAFAIFTGPSSDENASILLKAFVSDNDGERMLRVTGEGPASDPVSLGHKVADDLLNQGASEILSGLSQ